MEKNIKELISKDRIAERIREIGKQISKDYQNKSVLVLILANGGIFFAVDLLREIKKVSVLVECIRVSSYKNSTVSSGKLEIFGTLSESDFKDKDILIIDDVVDTGNTLSKMREKIKKIGASSVKICVLLDKPSRRVTNIVPDYSGFEIEDKFVVGFGLDYSGKYRELPFVGFID